MTLKATEQASAFVSKQEDSQTFMKSLTGFKFSSVQVSTGRMKASIHVALVIVSLYIEVG